LVKTINIQAAKTHLSRLVEEAAAGEEIVLAKAGRPMVLLVPFRKNAGKRKLGAFAGRVTEQPGCWEPEPGLEASFTSGPVIPVNRRARLKGQ